MQVKKVVKAIKKGHVVFCMHKSLLLHPRSMAIEIITFHVSLHVKLTNVNLHPRPQMDGWVGGWIGWMDRWMDGWIEVFQGHGRNGQTRKQTASLKSQEANSVYVLLDTYMLIFRGKKWSLEAARSRWEEWLVLEAHGKGTTHTVALEPVRLKVPEVQNSELPAPLLHFSHFLPWWISIDLCWPNFQAPPSSETQWMSCMCSVSTVCAGTPHKHAQTACRWGGTPFFSLQRLQRALVCVAEKCGIAADV